MSFSGKDAERSELLQIRVINIREEKISHQIKRKKEKKKRELVGNEEIEGITKKIKQWECICKCEFI